jgi:hypothetical protein
LEFYEDFQITNTKQQNSDADEIDVTSDNIIGDNEPIVTNNLLQELITRIGHLEQIQNRSRNGD